MKRMKMGTTAKAAATFLIALMLIVAVIACEGPAGAAGTPGASGTPGKDAPVNQAPVATAIPAATVSVGDTTKVDLATYFTDPEAGALIYGATTLHAKYATVAITGSVVTVTGVAEGEATVAVQATDSGGLIAVGALVVTVTKATTTAAPVVGTCGATATLAVAGTCMVTLTETERLETGNPRVVTVKLKKASKTVWVVTAVNKGSTSVRIVDVPSGVARIGFDVTVENRPPRLKLNADKTGPKDPPGIITMIAHDEAVTGFPYSSKPSLQRLYRVVIPGGFEAFFEDQDGDTMTYTVDFTSKTTAAVVKSPSEAGFLVDVVSAEAGKLGEFEFEVSAKDSDDAVSTETLTVQVNSELPRPRMYSIEQFKSGAFRPATVGFRSGVTHYLQFMQSEDADTTADGVRLRLVAQGEEDIAKLSAAARGALTTRVPSLNEDWKVAPDRIRLLAAPPATPATLDDDTGDRYIKLSRSGPITLTRYYFPGQADDQDSVGSITTPDVNETHPGGTAADADITDNPFAADSDTRPVLGFKLDGGGLGKPTTGTATITIEYYVVYDKDGPGDAAAAEEHMVESQTLTLTIMRVQ